MSGHNVFIKIAALLLPLAILAGCSCHKAKEQPVQESREVRMQEAPAGGK